MTKIRVLDNLTIQKIAAGEVIENPASVVKELVENSIDANGKNISIEIKNGGKDYIRITDDGDGMSKEDINIAFKRHSTSKLANIDDLYKIISLGFRGEALASISNISKVEVLSKTIDSPVGIQSIVEEGKVLSINKVGCPKGTTMIVRDLFYNIPVRKKFLKSDRIETNKINDILIRLSLGNSNISFKFIKDNKVVFQTNRTNNLLDTIYTLLGKEFTDNFISIDYKDDYIEIKGFISNNKLYRGNRSHQYLYINNRNIYNSTVTKAIENKYKSLIPLNRFPIFILNINLNPSELDVNIHPTKQEVKFINNEKVVDAINQIIEESLYPSINIPNIKFKREGRNKKEDLPKLFELNKGNDITNSSKDFIIKDFTDRNFDSNNKYIQNVNKNLTNEKPLKSNINKQISDNIGSLDKIENDKIKEEFIEEKTIKDYLLDINPVGRIFNTYILAESKIDEKLFIIDQHAAHERIMYERYKKEYEEEKVAIQQLISPEIIKLTNSEINKFEEYIDFFKKLGFDIEEFGPNSVALRGIPVIFGTPKGKDLFINILDNLNTNIQSSYDTQIEKIMKISCVNAIKSGDNINEVEIIALFKDLQRCNNPFTCPHGRPTIIEMTKKDIEKEFLRIK